MPTQTTRSALLSTLIDSISSNPIKHQQYTTQSSTHSPTPHKHVLSGLVVIGDYTFDANTLGTLLHVLLQQHPELNI